MVPFEREIAVRFSLAPATLCNKLRFPVRACSSGKRRSPGIQSGLGANDHCAAKGVEAVHRIRVEQIDTLDRRARKKIELDGVAERLVETAAIEVDRNPLWLPLKRRGRETAVDQVRLERIALRIVNGNGWN